MATTQQAAPALMPESVAAKRQVIEDRLSRLYGAQTGAATARRIFRMLETHRQLRRRSVTGPLWSHRDVVLITYGDTVQSPERPPLQTLRSFLKRNLPDAFSMVHVLPFFPWSSDGGFAVTDYRAVNPQLGTWEDIAALEQSFDLVFDLVLNHCSRENLWFIDYIAGQEPACDYFIEMNPAENLSLVTRPRSSPLLSGVRTHRGLRHVWTTFSNDQIDMNYANPEVLLEFIDIMLYYFRRGARMIRLDAVAYLWKQPGTHCIHLPQTHEIIRLFRDLLELVEPGALIVTETNVPHSENITYFGDGDETHLVYQFSLPPLLLHAIHSGNTQYLKEWAQSLESLELPDNCAFFNFTASHDGVGLRALEGLVPEEEISRMLVSMRERGGYISTRRNSDGRDIPYELNISYFDAFRKPHAEAGEFHIPAFLLSQIITLSFKGIPGVYIHSLLATPNDTFGVERTGLTRAVNRRQWDRGELESLINNPRSENGKVFHAYRRLLKLRRGQPAFHPDAPQQVLDLDNGLFGLRRVSLDGAQEIVCLFNCTACSAAVARSSLPADIDRWQELIGGATLRFTEQRLILPPFAACWFSSTDVPPTPGQAA
jgi:sucrose phosphorylase